MAHKQFSFLAGEKFNFDSRYIYIIHFSPKTISNNTASETDQYCLMFRMGYRSVIYDAKQLDIICYEYFHSPCSTECMW